MEKYRETNMKNITLVISLMVIAACSVVKAKDERLSEAELPCWITGDDWGIKTTQKAMLMTYLLPVNLDDPKGDAELRLEHGDYRFLGVGGLGVSYPSINMSRDVNALCEYGGRYIEGTSDLYEGSEHMALSSKFLKYAQSYNQYVIDHHYEKIRKN